MNKKSTNLVTNYSQFRNVLDILIEHTTLKLLGTPLKIDNGPKQVWWFQEFIVMIVTMKHRSQVNNQNDSILLL